VSIRKESTIVLDTNITSSIKTNIDSKVQTSHVVVSIASKSPIVLSYSFGSQMINGISELVIDTSNQRQRCRIKNTHVFFICNLLRDHRRFCFYSLSMYIEQDVCF